MNGFQIMGIGQSSQLPKPVLKIADKFPVEVWEKIFEFLPHKDRKVVEEGWRDSTPLDLGPAACRA